MSKTKTFEQYVIEYYGKSVYAIRLEVAHELFISGNRSADSCWDSADEFLEAMKLACGYSS